MGLGNFPTWHSCVLRPHLFLDPSHLAGAFLFVSSFSSTLTILEGGTETYASDQFFSSGFPTNACVFSHTLAPVLPLGYWWGALNYSAKI